MDIASLFQTDQTYRAATIAQEISPNDEMWKSSPEWYFQIGESGLKCVLNGLGAAWLNQVNRVLDLPCGHGRVLRHMKAAFPAAELFACDLDFDGVDFCQRTLGATAIYSKPDLCDVDLPSDLDVIWVGSLLTHVDADRTTRWLKKLASHLSPHGVLVATIHGLWSVKEQENHRMINDEAWNRIFEDYQKTGYGYARYTEFELGDYGISLSRAGWIMDVATTVPDTRVLAYTERGWANNHDVLVLTRNDRYGIFA